MPEEGRRGIGGLLLISPVAMSAWVVLAILAILGIVGVILWFVSPVFRFIVFIALSIAIVYGVNRFFKIKDKRYLVGIFAGLIIMFACANAFLSIFPETSLPVATGSVVSEETKVKLSEGLLLFSPLILAGFIAAPIIIRTKFGKKHEGLTIVLSTFLAAVLIWLFLWVV